MFNLSIVFLVFIYIIASFFFIKKHQERKKIAESISSSKKQLVLFFYERKILEILDIDSVPTILVYFMRCVLISGIIFIFFQIGYMALFFAIAILVMVYMRYKTRQLIESTGVEHTIITYQFLDVYVPAIASGISNNQAMLNFINKINSDELFEWWINKDELKKIDAKWTKIIDIYHMMQFNEEKGISNSLDIIKEIQHTIAMKQRFYDDYLAKMGEVKPIMLSYYIGVPIILFLSQSQVSEFWMSFGGFIASIILAVLFFIYEFFIYKIRKETIEIMF